MVTEPHFIFTSVGPTHSDIEGLAKASLLNTVRYYINWLKISDHRFTVWKTFSYNSFTSI